MITQDVYSNMLLEAIYLGSVELVESLIEDGADPLFDNYTIIDACVMFNLLDMLKALTKDLNKDTIKRIYMLSLPCYDNQEVISYLERRIGE